MRQCPDRCAFRAGRNLPDKEFRYQDRYCYGRRLLGLQFAPSLTLSALNLPAPGRRQPYTSPYGFAETCVLLNSRLGLFTAALSGLHPNRAPLLPKLRGHFAEFLTRVLSITLGFSRLPVSVCGTGTSHLARLFLGSVESGTSLLFSLAITAQPYGNGFAYFPA